MQKDVYAFAIFKTTTGEDEGDIIRNTKFSADGLAGTGRSVEASRVDAVVHHGNLGCDLREPHNQGVGHGLADGDDAMITAVDEVIQGLEEWASPAVGDVVLAEDVAGAVDYQ